MSFICCNHYNIINRTLSILFTKKFAFHDKIMYTTLCQKATLRLSVDRNGFYNSSTFLLIPSRHSPTVAASLFLLL